MSILKAFIVRAFHSAGLVFWRLQTIVSSRVGTLSEGFGMPLEDTFWETLARRVRLISHKSPRHGDVPIYLSQHNTISNWRAATFSTKEPETLEWIDGFEPTWNFIDVGTNVGLYSLYFLRIHSGHTLCLEPSVNNLHQLALNLKINGVDDRAILFPVAMGPDRGIAELRLGNLQPGSAETSAGDIVKNWSLQYRIFSMCLDDLIPFAGAKYAVKIDVDGLELDIIRGGKKLLSSSNCRTLMIENDSGNSERRHEIESLLVDSGFELAREEVSDLMASKSQSETVNQIWTKDLAR